MPRSRTPPSRLGDRLPFDRLGLVGPGEQLGLEGRASAPAGARGGRPRSSRRRPDCPGSAARASTPPGRCRARPPPPSGGRSLSVRLRSPPATLRRSARPSGLHPSLRTGAPVAWTSGAWRLGGSRASRSPFRSALRPRGLLWPRLTSRAAQVASPFQAQARSPQVRTLAVPAPPPDLRPRPLVARASRSVARSPCDEAASYPVPVRRLAGSFPASFSAALASDPLRFPWGPCDQVPQRTCTSESEPMLGAQHHERRGRP